MAERKRHTGGKPKVKPEELGRAVKLYRESDLTVAEIVAETGISRTTLFRYLKARDVTEVALGRADCVEFAEKPVEASALAVNVSAPSGGRRRCGQPSYERFWKMIEDLRGTKLSNAHAAYQRECEALGLRPLRFSSFCSGMRAWRRSEQISGAPEWRAGECMATYWSQVTIGGVRRRTFVARLVFSDATFACLAQDQSPLSWMICCEKALRHFGGVPFVVDCSAVGPGASGVTARTIATLQAFAAYYRFVLYGARPKTEKTAERSAKPLGPWNTSAVMRKVRADLAHAVIPEGGEGDALSALVDRYNGVAFDGRERLRDMRERELPQMLQLPKMPYDMAIWDTRVVGHDYHLVLDQVRFSVPWRYAGETVRIRYTADGLRVFAAGREIARHDRPIGVMGRGIVTKDEHRPPRHRHFAARMDHRFLTLAEGFGPSTRAVMVKALAACKAEGNGFRKCKELIDLSKKPSSISLEEACEQVLSSNEDVEVAAIAALMEVG